MADTLRFLSYYWLIVMISLAKVMPFRVLGTIHPHDCTKAHVDADGTVCSVMSCGPNEPQELLNCPKKTEIKCNSLHIN